MKGRRNRYTEAELAWIEARRDWPRELLHAVFVYVFARYEVTEGALNGLCKRNGWLTGRTGSFEKGHVPANKGKKMPFNPNTARTQFQKGHRPHTWRGAGHERIERETGHVILIVDEPNPYTGALTRPVAKHRWLWEQANGPVPEGQVLKCLDGDLTNTDPTNWEAVPRALLPRLAGRWTIPYDSAPAELKPVLLATARLENAAREARKRGRAAR